MKYPKWPIYATSEQITELSNLAKNEIVLRPKHGAPPPLSLLEQSKSPFTYVHCVLSLF